MYCDAIRPRALGTSRINLMRLKRDYWPFHRSLINVVDLCNFCMALSAR